jgi:hypothetical protein
MFTKYWLKKLNGRDLSEDLGVYNNNNNNNNNNNYYYYYYYYYYYNGS